MASYWYRVVPLLREAGHSATAVDLPGDDERAGLDVYAGRVIEAIGAAKDVALVAQSLGGFTVPLVCTRIPLRMLVFVNAMIPKPGETVGEWWGNTGSEAARIKAARRGGYGTEFDLDTYFFHDVPPDVVARGEGNAREQAKTIFRETCRFERWPKLPIHVVAGRNDRFFPLEFQRKIARERLGVEIDELPGGHLLALSNPRGLADKLLAYLG